MTSPLTTMSVTTAWSKVWHATTTSIHTQTAYATGHIPSGLTDSTSAMSAQSQYLLLLKSLP